MEIRLNRAELFAELAPMQGIVERRTTIPVLSHLLLRVSGDRLQIAATDLEVSLTSWCQGEVQEEGALAVQAKKLYEIVRASAGDEIILRLDQPGVLTILAGKSRFKIRGLPAEDFPTLPAIEGEESIRLPLPTFRAMIGKVFFAISSEESRFQLSGALMRTEENLLGLVATDGHRLSLVEYQVQDLEEVPAGVLVPRKALQELQRFENEGDLIFQQSDHHLSFTVDRRQLTCRILEGTFPDFERVIAKDNEQHVLVDRRQLAEGLHRVSLLTGDRTRAVRLEVHVGQLTLSAANPDLGEATEEVACDYEGPEIAVGFNPDYLRDFLAATQTDRVRLELKDEDTQCVAYPVEGPEERYVCVIMPIRL